MLKRIKKLLSRPLPPPPVELVYAVIAANYGVLGAMLAMALWHPK